MREVKKRIAPLAVALLLLAGMFTGMASAEEHKEPADIAGSEKGVVKAERTEKVKETKKKVDEVEKVKETKKKVDEVEKVKETKKKVDEIKREYRRERGKYQQVREEYQRVLEKQRDAVREYRRVKSAGATPAEMQAAAKEYLLNTVDAMILHIEVMKERITSVETLPCDYRVSRIDDHISRLEELKEQIRAAQTPQELRTILKELRSEWRSIKKEVKYFTGCVANRHIEAFLAKADRVSDKIEEVIEQLEASGADTTRLRELLERFNEEIDATKDAYEKAKDAYASHGGFDETGRVVNDAASDKTIKEARKYLREANQHIREAGKILKQIFKEIRKYKGAVILSGAGSLHAEGNGRAVIFGNLTIEVTAENATIIVSPNAKVSTSGEGTRVELRNGNIKYQGFGSAVVSGEQIRFAISGRGIVLDATGTGKAILKGEGTYYTQPGETHPWTGIEPATDTQPPYATAQPTTTGNTAVEG